MKLINNYRVCSGCKFSTLHFCNKFNETCLSVRINEERFQLCCKGCLKNDSYSFGIVPEEKESGLIAHFRVPGLNNFNKIKTLILMRQHYPEVFYENRKITAIYDAFPGTIWNGRQSNYTGKIYSVEELQKLKQEIEELDISLNLTWNNHLVQEKQCDDTFCNIITDVFHNGKHSITVASPILYNYLKNNYPNYTYYKSVIVANVNELCNEDYDFYVLNRNLNNNWEKLNKFSWQDRQRFELLCNDTCTPFCNRIYHYNLDNQNIITRHNPDDYISQYCTIDHDFMYFNNQRWPVTINPADIDLYLQKGFQHFKLCSRSDLSEMAILKIIFYLVKPEYILDVFNWTLNEITTTETIFKQNQKN